MKILKFRYLAKMIIQAETPLAVGSGERDVLTDKLVVTDVNGLPYIPGTALAGVLRHALEKNAGKLLVQQIMGFQGEKNEKENDEGKGSRLIFSHAQMIGREGLPIEGIVETDWNNPFYKPFQSLPVRQHVRITHKGAGEDTGKFDEQVVYKGTRFCFEVELLSDEAKESAWFKLLELFSSPTFRIGSGTRKGFGELSIVDCSSGTLDLSIETHLNAYLNKTSSFNDKFWENQPDGFANQEELPDVKIEDFGCDNLPENQFENRKLLDWTTYELNLRPVDFYLFSSGMESADAKMIPVTEKIVIWTNPQKPEFTKEQILIPATSLKGALAHRVAYHNNKRNKVFADTLTEDLLKREGYKMDIDIKSGLSPLFEIATKGNPAVIELFGYSAKGKDGKIGKIIFSDFIEKEPSVTKLFNHVAIDRFTGGAIEGALFSERVVYGKEKLYQLTIHVPKKGIDRKYIDAFEAALNDLVKGMLPLGGGTMRGHGCFTGAILKDGKEYKYEN